MRRVLGLTLAAALAGCAGQMNPPPATPTTAQIQASLTTLTASGIAPADYVSIGVTLESQQCYAWFSQQIASAQQTALGQGALGIGTAAAGIAGGPAGAGAAAGMGILSSLLGNNQANSPVGNDPVGAYILVNKTLEAWQVAAQNPQSLADAFAFVESYSELCQLPGIQSAIRAALSTANATATNPSVPAFGLAAALAPRRTLPPVVTVGH